MIIKGAEINDDVKKENLAPHTKGLDLYYKSLDWDSVKIKNITKQHQSCQDLILELDLFDDNILTIDIIVECKNDYFPPTGMMIEFCGSVSYKHIDYNRLPFRYNKIKDKDAGYLVYPGSEEYEYLHSYLKDNLYMMNNPGIAVANLYKINVQLFSYYFEIAKILNLVDVGRLQSIVQKAFKDKNKEFPLTATPNRFENDGWCSISMKILEKNYGDSLIKQISIK